MIDSSWHIEEPLPDVTASSGSPATLVTLHFIRAALRRRWRLWVGLGCVGMLLGLAFTFGVPAKSIGTTTLLLAHDPATDPAQAMATDVSLLRTRTVAASVINHLELDTTPDSFQQSVTPTAVSSDVLVIEVSGSNDAAAVARTRAVSDAFLSFRTAQLRSQSDALISGYQKRIASLQQQSDRLTQQYNSLGTNGSGGKGKGKGKSQGQGQGQGQGPGQAADILAQRSQVNAEINTFQQTIQDTTLKTNSIVAASHVLDSANLVPHSSKKRAALAMASGLIAGTAMGMGLVVIIALTSERLRRRDEVAAALGVPVRLSVPSYGRRLPGHGRFRGGSQADRDRQVLVRGVESVISPHKRPSRKARPPRLALATVDNPEVATLVMASLGAELSRRGLAVFLVDLTESGRLADTLASALKNGERALDSSIEPVVFRPEGVPSLARGPVGATVGLTIDLPDTDPLRPAWDRADVVLTVAEIDPSVGAEHLRSWADQMILLVTAGRSSAERLRTTGELVRSAELKMPFAIMVGADRADESLGLPESLDPDLPEGRRTS